MLHFAHFRRILTLLLLASSVIFSQCSPRLYANTPEPNAQNETTQALATAESAARCFLEGCATNDWDKVQPVWAGHLDDRVKRVLGGLTVVSLGKAKYHAFTSSTILVPCEVQRKGDGRPEKRVLSLKQNKPTGLWRVVGGI
jgi:hypothetical protein